MEMALGIVGLALAVLAAWWIRYTLQQSSAHLVVRIYEPSDGQPGVAIFHVTNSGGEPVTVVTAGLQSSDDSPSHVRHLRGPGRETFSLEHYPMPPFTLQPAASWHVAIPRFEIVEEYGETPTVRPFVCGSEGHDFLGDVTTLWGPAWHQQLAEIEEARRRM